MHRPKRPDDIARESAGDPPEPLGTRDATTGTVKSWRDDKGHGIIATDATAPWDIWCHFSALDGSGFKTLQVGEGVEVEYVRTNQETFRYCAERVRRLGAGSMDPV